MIALVYRLRLEGLITSTRWDEGMWRVVGCEAVQMICTK